MKKIVISIGIILVFSCMHLYTQNNKQETPIIFNQNESVEPGGAFGVQGHAFGDNPEMWYQLIEGNEKKLKPESQLEVIAHSTMNLSAGLPENPFIKQGSLIAVWIKNGKKFSEPVFINKARIVTVEYTELSPGYIFRVFGRNLFYPNRKPEVSFLDITLGQVHPAEIIKGESYILTIKAPATIKPGNRYRIQVNNGFGGKWGQSLAEEVINVREAAGDPFGIGVPWVGDYDFHQNVYNVLTDTRLKIKAKGNDTNDREAIQQAIDLAHANGGGVVYLPKGIYRLEFSEGSGLVMKSKVVLKGDGQEQTIIRYGYGTPPAYPDPIGKGGWPDETTEGVTILWPAGTNLTGLADLMLQNVNTSGRWRHSLKTMPPKEKKMASAGYGYFAVNCHFDLAVSWGLSWAFVDKMAIVGCHFDLKAQVTWPWPWHCDGVSNFVVRNNRVFYSAGRFGFNEGLNGIIENNHITRYGDLQTERGETGGFNIDYAKDIVILGNKMDVTGKTIKAQNQGETILSQGCNPFGQSLGVVSSATSTSLVDLKQDWPPLHTASTDYKGGVNVLLPTTSNAVAIVDGSGTGQWRYIVKNDKTTLVVDRPWDVTPDATSHYVVVKWSAEDWLIKDNILDDNHQGIMLYCGGVDVAIVGNKLTNSGGIYMRSDQRSFVGRYNLTWNVSVADNSVVNTNGLRSAHVAMYHVKVTNDNAEIFGTGTIGVEMRRNLVQASIPNVSKAGGSSGLGAEGYFNCVFCGNADKTPCDFTKIAILGTIIENNTAINTENAYSIGAGAYNTVLIPGKTDNFDHLIKNINGGAPVYPPIESPNPPVPISFTLDNPGYVTLVIERPDGFRVRNLISETWFVAGKNTVWWDCLDDLGRDADAANHGVYHVPGQFVEPGEYRVRGLVRGEIRPRYEFSPYTTGTPPWATENHTGEWLANHTPPMAAVFLPSNQSPTGQPVVMLGCYVTEGPDGLAWVDLDGKKLGGKKWIGGNWTAAPYLARDAGEKAISGHNAYVASVWETGKQSGILELRITALTNGKDQPVILHVIGEAGESTNDSGRAAQIGGLAVHNGIAVVSLTMKNQLILINTKEGKVIGTIPLKAPKGLAVDANGRLLALSENKLLRFNTIENLFEQPSPKTIISGLTFPCAVTSDENGHLYISERGNNHQVKVYASNGKFIRAIGNPGIPKAGPYDPLHMNNPAGLAIDSKQQLWVTEEDYLPKRVSVWTLDGKFIQAFYGPGKYGGGGTIDPQDKTKFYYSDEGHGAMEFDLDWNKGTYQLTQVYFRPAPGDMKMAFRSAGPETPLYFKGRRYFTNSYNSSPTSGHTTAFLFIDRNGIACPVAAMGQASLWDVLKSKEFKSHWPEGVNLNEQKASAQAFFIWTDNNEDAQVQVEEVQFKKTLGNGVIVTPDLSFNIARVDDKAMKFEPAGFSGQGIPQYDINKGIILAEGVLPPASSGGNQALTTADGWTILTLGMSPFSRYSISGAKNGVPMWSYPNLWPGLHASHTAPKPDHPGEIIGPTRLLGGLFDAKKPEVGKLWGINSNHGHVYLFTADGLFVATIFEDMRIGKRWTMPVAQRGMELNGITLSDENFWPTITQTSDGKVYLVDGARSAIVRLDGIDNISRLSNSSITVTKEDIEKSTAYSLRMEAFRQKGLGDKTVNIPIASVAPIVDGNLADWNDAEWIDIDKSGVKAYFNANTKPYDITASMKVIGDQLYLAYKTGNENLLKNSGEMPVAPFKTGGALDLMISTNPNADPQRQNPVQGDYRVLLTLSEDKPWALIYRAVVDGTKENDKIPFSSPWRTITFDQVEDISKQIRLAGLEGNYEVAIPLSILGLKPADMLSVKGDIGILRGEGGQTTARIYWNNKATGITADVPSEAMLTPALWGTFHFVKSK